jgi:heme/copper-type cytochrome/quinol oxidase subunit 3
MALTTLLALWPAAHALVLGVVAGVLTLPIVRAIFLVAVLLHLSEATAAAVLAWRSRERKRTLGWTAQTLLLGYPSLRLLLQRLAPRPSIP